MAMVKNRSPRATHYLHVLPGLERIASQELLARAPRAVVSATATVRDRNGLVLLSLPRGQSHQLLSLRTVEDVFSVLALDRAVPWGREGLARIFQQLLAASLSIDGVPDPSGQRCASRGGLAHLSFRVIARLAGPKQPYLRRDLARTVAAALKRRSKRKWRSVKSGEDIEVWANLVGRQFICGVRLSDASMRHRPYQKVHLPAALRPSMAAALAWLTNPQPNEIFLDPMCGSGTVLIERALMQRYRLLIGGDIHTQALDAASANIGPKHKPRHLLQWDAAKLPLATGTVDKVACNLPFGKKVRIAVEPRLLYTHMLGELARVLRPGGIAVLLAGQRGPLMSALRDSGGLVAGRRYGVYILGEAACIHVLKRS